jgi:hypothetical protein
MSDLDHRARLAAFAFLVQQRQLHGETVPRADSAQGVDFGGPIPVILCGLESSRLHATSNELTDAIRSDRTADCRCECSIVPFPEGSN